MALRFLMWGGCEVAEGGLHRHAERCQRPTVIRHMLVIDSPVMPIPKTLCGLLGWGWHPLVRRQRKHDFPLSFPD